MNRNKYRYSSYKFRLLTIFLCLAVAAFMVYGPRLIKNRAEYQIVEDQPDEEWQGVITLWDFPRPYRGGGSGFGWIKEKIKEFEEKHRGVLVELHCLDENNGEIQLDLAVQSGRYPDIAPVGNNFGWAQEGVLEPLDDYFTPGTKEMYLDYALRAVTYKGSIWGIPLYGTAPVMLLNLEIFEKRGVEPPPGGQWTYDEFVDILGKLTYDKDNDGDTDVYGFNSYIMNGSFNLWGILLSDGWEIFDLARNKYTLHTPEAVSGLKKLVALAQEYKVVPEDFGVQSSSRAWLTFVREKKVAVYPAGLWAVFQLENLKNEGTGFEYGIAEYPVGELGHPVTAGSGVISYGVFRQKDREKRDMCIKFLDFISGDFDDAEAAKRGVLPVKASPGQQSMVVDPMHIKTIPRMEKWSYVEDIINNHIRQAVLGVEEPDEALKLAQQEVDMLFGEK